MPVSTSKAEQVAKYAEKHGAGEASIWFDISVDSVKRYMRKASRTDKLSEGPVLVVGDIHAPYHHPQAIEFLKWVHSTKECRDGVVCDGDIADFHSMSRHIHETDASSPALEYEKMLEFTAELCEAFPEGNLVLGNHDLIPQRQMKEIGLPARLLGNLNAMYGMGDGWNIHPLYHVIKPDSWDVLVEHGVGSGGKYGCANTAKEKRCSYVQGHIHSAAAVIYSTNHESTIFGMNTGCLVDADSLAMRYGKYGIKKGVLGCGVVYSGEHAEFVPMSSWPEYEG